MDPVCLNRCYPLDLFHYGPNELQTHVINAQNSVYISADGKSKKSLAM